MNEKITRDTSDSRNSEENGSVSRASSSRPSVAARRQVASSVARQLGEEHGPSFVIGLLRERETVKR